MKNFPSRTFSIAPWHASQKAFFQVCYALVFVAFFTAARVVDAASYTWSVTSGNWSTPTNWSPNTGSNGPLAGDTLVFSITNTSPSSSTVNNTVDSGFGGSIAALKYASTNVNAYHVTQIPSGRTLTISSNLAIGSQNGVQLITQTYMTGGGTLLVYPTTTATNFTVENYGSASGANSTANLDLTGLGTFIYNDASGTIGIAETGGGSLTRAGGNLTLAGGSNSITAAVIDLATCNAAQAGPNSSLTLGSGTNIINVGTFNVANNKNSATVSFKNGTGGLRLRGVSGADTDRANIILGNRNQAGTGTCAGTLALNGSPVDIEAEALIVGTNNSAGTTGDTGTGVLQFDTGKVDATTVIMGASVTASGAANGTITVGANGNLIVGSGGLSLVTQTSTGTATGTLNISNGIVVCNGSIVVGSAAGTSTINFVTGGKLSLASGAFAGMLALPIGNLNLAANSTLQFGIPSSTQTNIVVTTLTWPVSDSVLTISVGGLPANVMVGDTFPLIQFASMNGGPFTSPALVLPPGVTGNLSQTAGNTIVLTITGGVGPGVGGLNQLSNAGFEQAKSGWTTTGNTAVITVGSATYLNSTNGACPPDSSAQLVVSHSGTNVAYITGANLATGSTNSWTESAPTVAGSTFTAGAYAYVSHEDLLAGKNSFYYEVDFLNGSGTLLASYESYVISNLTCGETVPFAVDTWVLLAVTNQMQVTNGINTGVVVSNTPTASLTAPPGAQIVRFSALFVQQGPPDNHDSGSVYFDDANLGLVSGPILPTLSPLTPNLVALCTNQDLTCTANSTVSVITNVQIIAMTTTLGALSTNTTTYNLGAPSLNVAGLNTSNANISLTLLTNTIYLSVVVKATDANGVTVTSPADLFDTLTPTLVIEAADFNFSGGQFIDTPPDGGFNLYVNQIGQQGIDENKVGRTGEQQSYYRPSDAVINQAAAADTGTPPTATEEKYVTAAANGDTNDYELEVGYNSPGDWLNYTRTFDTNGSAPAGTYNIWSYLATSGTGTQATLAQVTSSPTTSGQSVSNLGSFGTASFSDNGYFNYRYVPLVDQFGNRVTVTLTNGQQTLRSTVVGNPNLAFYMLTPVAPTFTPVLLHYAPNGLFQVTNDFTFTLGPANGAPISSNGIQLIVNGIDVTALAGFSQNNGLWTLNFPIPSNMTYSAVINVTNNNGLASSFPISFDTFNANNYQWEAVDYDFSTNSANGDVGGLFIDNPVPTCDTNAVLQGTLATNSYYGYPAGYSPAVDPFQQGSIAQQGVDMNWADAQSGANNAYRLDGVGSQVATDYLRPKFIAAQQQFNDPNIGEFNIGFFNAGNWLNYTRTYPTNTFNIWGRLAGGAGAFSGTTLSIVTSGAGTTLQASNVLGTFSDPNPAGWQSYHWIPLLAGNGNPAQVQLGGKATLKLTSGNNLNALFFMLVPVTTAQPFRVSASAAGNQISISIPTQNGHTYTLYSAQTLNGAWSQVGGPIAGDGTVHIVTLSANGSQGFYRAAVQ